jgi:hypothetical protein
MELGVGDVMGLQQGIAITAPSPRGSGDLGLLKRAALTQAAAGPYPSPFLDEQKMLRFSKAAHTLPSGLDAASVLNNTFFPGNARSFSLPFIHTVGPRCRAHSFLLPYAL